MRRRRSALQRTAAAIAAAPADQKGICKSLALIDLDKEARFWGAALLNERAREGGVRETGKRGGGRGDEEEEMGARTFGVKKWK